MLDEYSVAAWENKWMNCWFLPRVFFLMPMLSNSVCEICASGGSCGKETAYVSQRSKRSSILKRDLIYKQEMRKDSEPESDTLQNWNMTKEIASY